MSKTGRWVLVVLFAVAFAWVEAALVLDLRTLVDRIQPYQPTPLPEMDVLGSVELVRELATLLMLFTVGALAGTTGWNRFGYGCLAFGVWDIFYYVFLRIMTGWPVSLLDWDILFLLPLPWWGPVISPALIGLLMIIGGTTLGAFDEPQNRLRPSRVGLLAGTIGAVLALYAFMVDALRTAPEGTEALREMLPQRFAWEWYIPGVLLMAVTVGDLVHRAWRRQRADRE